MHCSLRNRLSSALRRVRNLLPRRRASPPKRARATTEDWALLVEEFETRASAGRVSSMPRQGDSPRVNPEIYEMLPFVEAAFMAAITTTLWYLGRIFRMDAFLLLMYPLPGMYVAARWDSHIANQTILASLFLILCTMGPIYAVLFVLNSGLLTMAYSRGVAKGWSWSRTLAVGAIAEAVGLVFQVLIMNAILRVNSWSILFTSMSGMLTMMCSMLSRIPFVPTFGALSDMAIRIAMVVLIVFNSAYHVLCTLILSSLMLMKISETEKLKQMPLEVPFLRRLLNRSRPDLR